MSKIKDFEFKDYGVGHAQYFQGCGKSFTRFDYAFVGIGYSQREAYEDALEQACMSLDFDSDDDPILKDIESKIASASDHDEVIDNQGEIDEDSELYYYAALMIQK